jgi:hypothetical protein
MSALDTLNLSRREVHAFQQWLKSLPKEQTLFLFQTYETEQARTQKLKDLYSRYQTEKSKK